MALYKSSLKNSDVIFVYIWLLVLSQFKWNCIHCTNPHHCLIIQWVDVSLKIHLYLFTFSELVLTASYSCIFISSQSHSHYSNSVNKEDWKPVLKSKYLEKKNSDDLDSGVTYEIQLLFLHMEYYNIYIHRCVGASLPLN